MTKTAVRFLAAIILAAFGIMALSTTANAATAPTTKTTTKTTWNAAHTVKTTVSHTVRKTGTTDTTTVTKYRPKVKGKAQIKISVHRVSLSVTTKKDGTVSEKRTTTDTVYDAKGQEISEDKVVEEL